MFMQHVLNAERGGGGTIVAEIVLDFVSGCFRQIMLILPADISQAFLTPRIRDSSSCCCCSCSSPKSPGLTHYPTANTLSKG